VERPRGARVEGAADVAAAFFGLTGQGALFMKPLLAVVMGCALFASVPPSVEAQDTREARGTVTAVTPASLSIKVKDQVMTFKVDEKTQVTARGASTQTRAAEAEGRKGPDLPSIVKVGQGVEVRYHEQGMHAASIRVLPGPVEGSVSEAEQKQPERQTMNGTVTAVTGTSLAVKTSAGEMTFVIDKGTDVIGAGLGTAAAKKKEAGEVTVITDFVAVGDSVRVHYREMGDMKHASEVHVTRKGTVKK